MCLASRPTEQPIRPAVSLCIPTFRGPDGLRKVLAHVAKLDYQGPLSVTVVDNNVNRPASEAIVGAMPKFPFPLTSIVAPRRGWSYAYNAGFAAARTAQVDRSKDQLQRARPLVLAASRVCPHPIRLGCGTDN
jgi:glycosyltransferase involved in cell wall biosynthesis